MSTYKELGTQVGALVDEKNVSYGSAFHKAAAFLQLLFPDGIPLSKYGDMLALVRIFDKQCRIATNPHAFGESPYSDIAGYGLLGLDRVNKELGAMKLNTTDAKNEIPLFDNDESRES